jgi:hypothetical protein
MSVTTDPNDENHIINEFIADPDASTILRQALTEIQDDSPRLVTEDGAEAHDENATDELESCCVSDLRVVVGEHDPPRRVPARDYRLSISRARVPGPRWRRFNNWICPAW